MAPLGRRMETRRWVPQKDARGADSGLFNNQIWTVWKRSYSLNTYKQAVGDYLHFYTFIHPFLRKKHTRVQGETPNKKTQDTQSVVNGYAGWLQFVVGVPDSGYQDGLVRQVTTNEYLLIQILNMVPDGCPDSFFMDESQCWCFPQLRLPLCRRSSGPCARKRKRG